MKDEREKRSTKRFYEYLLLRAGSVDVKMKKTAETALWLSPLSTKMKTFFRLLTTTKVVNHNFHFLSSLLHPNKTRKSTLIRVAFQAFKNVY
jgi:hypothetical protein